MIDHLGISVADVSVSARFYDTVLATLGHRRLMDFGHAIGYGTDKPDFWISHGTRQGSSDPSNRESHVAFRASSQEQVESFFETALGLGAEELHAPRLWPEYHPGYYGAFVRDPDGNNVEAVWHGTAG